MNAREEIQSIIDTLTESLADADKFDGGNDSAGVRVRKALKAASDACKTSRATVQEERNSRKAAKASIA